jgi:hypothetical protein
MHKLRLAALPLLLIVGALLSPAALALVGQSGPAEVTINITGGRGNSGSSRSGWLHDAGNQCRFHGGRGRFFQHRDVY